MRKHVVIKLCHPCAATDDQAVSLDGKPARQSSTYGGYTANLAVDRNIATYSYADNGANETNVPAWLQIDLQQICKVNAFYVYGANIGSSVFISPAF